MADNIDVTEPIIVKIRRLAHGRGVSLPLRMTAESAGMDLSAAVENPVELQAGAIALIPCGFAMSIPPGYEAQVRPRSGLASKFGITLINSPGTIDSDYRGEVKIALVNHGPAAFTVERNSRIAQMVILPVPAVEVIEVDDLDPTPRGVGGFGHTGR